MDSLLTRLPAWLTTVPYDGSRIPGSAGDPASGANCQVYAYAVLRHFGRAAPDLRSRELWHDTAWTSRVSEPEPLDLALFNRTADPFGAHVGIWTDDDRVLHLCAEIGSPAVWTPAQFATREHYRTLIGFKRCHRA
ncbi:MULTISPECIES: hydrolase [Amycolatopsis]|uniref:hydrolase n=1 Tax=Amycolatopsis TaxID=1813 RepID=UPI000B8B2801|nr:MULTISPECIES: hydrolase [Amycolatopsis]OXM70977.1 hydrolase [Amycolatopsis sp. KNN50.9b]